MRACLFISSFYTFQCFPIHRHTTLFVLSNVEFMGLFLTVYSITQFTPFQITLLHYFLLSKYIWQHSKHVPPPHWTLISFSWILQPIVFRKVSSFISGILSASCEIMWGMVSYVHIMWGEEHIIRKMNW